MKKKFPGNVIPLYIWMVLLVGVPLLYVFAISFFKRGPLGNIVFEFTLDNYMRIFDPLYLKVFGISILTALAATAITLLVGYPFAYFTAKQSKRRKGLILLLVIIPFWTSGLVRMSGWIILLRSEGVINHLLMSLHLIDAPLKLLYNYGAVMVGMVYTLLPFMIMPLYNSIEKLDWSVVEAARDLGASKSKAFLTVTLPQTAPGIVSGCMLVFVPSIGMFFISDLLGGAKAMLLGNLIQNQFSVVRDWPFGAALSVLMMLCSLIFIFAYSKVSGGKDMEIF